MPIDIEAPSPPDLTNRSLPSGIDPTDVTDSTGDLRREELETALREGAWDDAFGEWTEYTDLNEAEYRAVHDAGLVESLDFYWDPVEGGVRFELPSIPDGLGDDGSLSSLASTELADLGETVRKVLEGGYIDWSELETDEQEMDENL
ncbi:hypothetical protein JCM30237_24970 [Halolamina litorea]|uniref:Rhodanese domain-containing protein n=1 Tax=Halolamina litorea TaxID=1515593 RepID=A0ABD6BUB7_9EURY|nr:hypothetical protein [Halolamina litorea]